MYTHAFDLAALFGFDCQSDYKMIGGLQVGYHKMCHFKMVFRWLLNQMAMLLALIGIC